LHRPSNVDEKESLESMLNAFNEIQRKTKLIFPMHPRTKKNIDLFGLNSLLNSQKNLILTEPLGYLDFQKLLVNSNFVITDSGGVQEETTALKIPCITLRENTERPITVWEGSNELIGFDMKKLIEYSNKAIEANWKESKVPALWDGKTSERVVDILENFFK
jgi:UDP-N-acetylglucosamine 2-epimerase (non-hydrolysing)